MKVEPYDTVVGATGALPLPPVPAAYVMVGVKGVTDEEEVDAAEVPTELTATTPNVYEVPS
jgi:hypothetical protein